ncbi:trifunctional transcriptional regulator/proline dehydrogenase/L-glutamate gamma-semialdehyde dehydrogenase [Vandammella animalimorsus]|uniref:Bifunctional protein PutA n=1 Tax=Vandammella animalimorsus TaxID=2029117 RepID=A0A2A2T4A9_9BURK|nr:bifunctional proline dehydrogenase/L-glutamate gamma-semialdehyde dehydrogenase PutA [Vandammella animalimorsus]PAT32489.1 trifunctional transcriptional regulator/proline dehydrogenase/L-glutamate gamma-semialdehyde dehydrogenase [Vandammella animalimorsus]PAX16031.1 trifunctional transcriptional regulator/proline dehydrogenase/L-glutamate gamma-semialdehyde dehydrogenase [Vandammella animalimorsus]PAX20274.1 trifunctional transcriptional regulator/proline dehydrogenase/L-glutamate gamma-semi
MGTTLGIKVDESIRERLRQAAQQLGCSPHWLHKQALLAYIEAIEKGVLPPELAYWQQQGQGAAQPSGDADAAALPALVESSAPFLALAQDVQPQSVLRAAITAAYRRPETECLPVLIEAARAQQPEQVRALAMRLVQALRAKRLKRSGGVEALVQEYSLSSQEGVALMCLAEALLRIPDRATRDALIRDKISQGDWKVHADSPSMFVNAATWGLMITGKLVAVHSERSLGAALTRLIAKGGEPLIRQGVNTAMRMMGEQFVTGQTIAAALANSRKWEEKGFRYSYDMLGEAAATEADALRYLQSYEQAIHAIGKAAQGRGIYEGPGISVKLSALHPRYSRAQRERVMQQLYPRLLALVQLARQYDVGLNIDAEEADRLELSLDLLERLCLEPSLAGWNGIGFVVQAYQKRAPFVLDWLIELARRSRRRLMVRLVKGAYWDSEIKRAQLDGLEGYPVYTRKLHTDVAYLACARKLLAAPDAVYPQFASHNAQTLASIYHMAGQNYYPGQYEFQCLHGMGEALYEEVVGPVAQGKLGRPCRIYAPVGSHETLLAYLVRRLLENGANSSFVHQIGDESIPIEQLVADPVQAALQLQPLGRPHERIALPVDLYQRQGRRNSMGLDLSNEQRLGSLSAALLVSAEQRWLAQPAGSAGDEAQDGQDGTALQEVRNPADRFDLVGHVRMATPEQAQQAVARAVAATPIWQATPVAERAQALLRAAQWLEDQLQPLMGLLVREAGKSLPNAIAEVREAVDFLRYYARQAEEGWQLGLQPPPPSAQGGAPDAASAPGTAGALGASDTPALPPAQPLQGAPLGPVLCISPWNFPLAIFVGQIAAALAAGNVVLAKPAEQTCLIAAQAVALLHRAGVPADALQLLPGPGETVGAALVAHPEVKAVVFTGSTAVAQTIQRSLAARLDEHGKPIPLIAETGGINAMVVDSSALAEQVVADVLSSAFDSAGQRCSALRLLCVQEDCAERLLQMLRGAMQELRVGRPDQLNTDVGPVIDAQAQAEIEQYVAQMREAGFGVQRLQLDAVCRQGTFVAPTLIEVQRVADVQREVFGPVLHVLRYPRSGFDALLAQINALGFGLTFGVHTRLDETIAQVSARIQAGNLYVNRNIVGAVVGVQPFGGEGLSGTGPKAGGPLYLPRLVRGPQPGAQVLRPGAEWTLQGPTGELNRYRLLPRGQVWCLPRSLLGLQCQWLACAQSGNGMVLADTQALRELYAQWLQGMAQEAPPDHAAQDVALHWCRPEEIAALPLQAALFEGDADELLAFQTEAAQRSGPLLAVQGLSAEELAQGVHYRHERLLREVAISINTAAAGGNASLMSIDAPSGHG